MLGGAMRPLLATGSPGEGSDGASFELVMQWSAELLVEEWESRPAEAPSAFDCKPERDQRGQRWYTLFHSPNSVGRH
jgi:hypothetical protein